jgi:isoamylase
MAPSPPSPAPAAASTTLFAGVVAGPGAPTPLGPSLASPPPPPPPRAGWFGTGKVKAADPPPTGTVNFAVWSGAAEAVTLVLLDPATRAPAAEFPLTRCAGADGVWAVSLSNLPLAGVGYAYRATGPHTPMTRWGGGPSALFLDPRAPLVDCGRPAFGVRSPTEGFVPGLGTPFIGSFDFASPPFDWGNDGKEAGSVPRVKPEDLVIYEVGVRPFTAGGGWKASTSSSSSSPVVPRGSSLAGTYAGLADRAPYLASLGVTAVELLPIFEYDELEFRRFPNARDHMTNVWGYSHASFFAPMARFGAQGGVSESGEGGSTAPSPGGFGAASAAAAAELKAAIKALHSAGIAVILDVVYNHTAESDDATPYPLSWRGLDAGGYYMLDPGASPPLLNFSGCGNTVAANEHASFNLILDSLRHWVTEFHVDGFRFDLASALTRDRWGKPLEDPPLIRAAAEDPVVGRTLLIAEPWDCGGLYQVGSFPHHGVWAEWNGRFRDDVRRFARGDPGAKRAFAARLAGSSDVYGGDGPGVPNLPAPRSHARPAWHSINFVTAHDGFSLGDLVAYAHKHNEANGEGGRDGSDDNLSWNCGVEGPSADPAVCALRARVARSHMLALFLAAGTPMLVSGDEYLSTHAGNNNWYGHDTPLAWFDWGAAAGEGGVAFTRFVSGLAALRRAHPLLGGGHRWTADDVTWHEDHWDNDESRFLAFELHPRGGGPGERLFAAFNAHGYGVPVPLPPGRRWARVVDTNLPPPRDFTPGGNAGVDPPTYMMEAHSAILLVSRD